MQSQIPNYSVSYDLCALVEGMRETLNEEHSAGLLFSEVSQVRAPLLCR